MPSRIPVANAARRHPLKGVYFSMLQRCYKPDDSQFKDYGGRGITVCERWSSKQPEAQGFWNFVSDMGERPAGATLDRKDNNGNYEPSNCHWATRAEQQRNRRNNLMITYDGRIQCAKDWATELNLDEVTIARRYRKGLPLEMVFSKIKLNRKAG